MDDNTYQNAANPPIRILHVIQGTFAYGGTPKKLLSLVKYSDHSKFRHIFLVFANHHKNLNQEFIAAGAIVKEVKRLRNWDIRLLWDIVTTCRLYCCNLINTHFARADIYGTIAGILTHIPVVKYVHGIAWNKSPLLQRIDSLLLPFRVCTICNSEATRNIVIRQTSAGNTKVIYNGVPALAVHPILERRARKRTEIDLPQDAFVIGHVGGLVEWRRQDLILDAISVMYEKGVNVYCAIAGKGPEEINLKEHAKSLNITDRVRFLDYIDDVGEFLASIDVFVNMAHSEGFGIAVVEAMQAGLPVVLANAGALPELIEDGKSGLLVPAGDAEALANALTRLANEAEFARRLGEAGKQRAIHEFSIERYTREMEYLYEKVSKER